jgi:hypothetical protein
VLLLPHDRGPADWALPGIKAKQGKEIQLQKALAADTPQLASAFLAMHHDSPGNVFWRSVDYGLVQTYPASLIQKHNGLCRIAPELFFAAECC